MASAHENLPDKLRNSKCLISVSRLVIYSIKLHLFLITFVLPSLLKTPSHPMSEKMSLADRDRGAYELSPLARRPPSPSTDAADPDSEPLLPVYSASSASHSKPIHPSPHRLHLQATRSHRLRRTLSCLCICLLVLVPTVGLLGCFFGENAVQRVKGWDRVPEEWREWLGEIIAEKGKGKVDPGNFPTE